MGFEPLTSRYWCIAPTKLWSHWCWELVNYVLIHCVHNCKDHSSFDSLSVVLIKNNVRTNSKENTRRLLITLKIHVDGQHDKNNEHDGMKNVCFLFFFYFCGLWASLPWNEMLITLKEPINTILKNRKVNAEFPTIDTVLKLPILLRNKRRKPVL